MQVTTVILSAILAAASTHAQPFAAVIDRYTQQGCVPFGTPGGGSFILNPTTCNLIPPQPPARSVTLTQIFPGCKSMYK